MKFFMTLMLFTNLCFSMEGLKEGSTAPNLTLKNTLGEEFEIGSKKSNYILIFFRGSWCPYCIKQLKKVNHDLVGKTKNYKVLAISVDKLKIAKKMKKSHNFKFNIISDPKAKSLKAFNIINKLDPKLVKKYKESYSIDVEKDSGEKHHMVAHPAVYIVKGKNIIFSDVHLDYKKRTENKIILEKLKE